MTDGEAQSPPAEAGDAVDPPETGPGLRRDDDRRVIAGVCAGLGAYTGVDPVLWRTGFALTAFAGGTGLLLYVAAWMLMRDPQGGPATFEQMLDRAIPSRAVPRLLAVGLMGATALSLVGGFGWATLVLAIPLVLGLLTARARGMELRSVLSGLRADLARRDPPPTGPVPQPSAAYYNPAQPWASAPHGPVDLAVVSERTSRDAESDDDLDDPADDEEGAPEGRDDGKGGEGCFERRSRPSPLASHALWTVVTMAVALVVAAPHLGSVFHGAGSTDLLFGPVYGLYFMAAAVAVVGVFSLIGTWAGNTRGLLFLGTLAVLGAVLVGTFDLPRAKVGEAVWEPETVAHVEEEPMRLNLGRGVLDLSRLGSSLEAGQSVDVAARVDHGVLVVVLPEDARVDLTAGAGWGMIDPTGAGADEMYGADLTYEEVFDPPEGGAKDEPNGPETGTEEEPETSGTDETPVINVNAETAGGVVEVRYGQARD
ncbi:PspC domain-containing protein [Nocardiopsis alba]|uniref:PspC domain-containing protein n=1 Tax=Nocardiopsis alba TaxID=53437 RepID=UPI00034BE099|nr:PspC domain-containing protein [Nocardiopsis alba]